MDMTVWTDLLKIYLIQPLENPGQIAHIKKNGKCDLPYGYVLRQIYCTRRTGTHTFERLKYLFLSEEKEFDQENHTALYSNMWFTRDKNGEYNYPVEADTGNIEYWTCLRVAEVLRFVDGRRRLHMCNVPMSFIGVCARKEGYKGARWEVSTRVPLYLKESDDAVAQIEGVDEEFESTVELILMSMISVLRSLSTSMGSLLSIGVPIQMKEPKVTSRSTAV